MLRCSRQYVTDSRSQLLSSSIPISNGCRHFAQRKPRRLSTLLIECPACTPRHRCDQSVMFGPLPPRCQIKHMWNRSAREHIRRAPTHSNEVDLAALLPMHKCVATGASCTGPRVYQHEAVRPKQRFKLNIAFLLLFQHPASYQAWYWTAAGVEISAHDHQVTLWDALKQATKLRPEMTAPLRDSRGLMLGSNPLVAGYHIQVDTAIAATHL